MRSTSVLAFLPIAALATACAVTTSDASGTDESEVREGGVCTTLDYGHARPNADYFLPFAGDDAVKEYATAFLAAMHKPPFKEVSHDVRLVKLLDDVYAGFKKVFPRETAGFDAPPRIVIVDSEEMNAFAGFDDRPEVQKAPWLFFVHSSILARPFDDSQLRGLFVHELAHLILRNVLPETRAKIRVHYRARAASPIVLGNVADDDASARARIEELRTLGEKVGRFPELGPLPLGLFAQTEYQQTFAWFRSQRAASSAPEACAASDDAFGRLNTAIQARASSETYTLGVDAAQRAELAALVSESASALRRCYAHVKGSVFEVKVRAKLASVPAEQAGPILAKVLDPSTPEHQQAFDELMPDPIEREVDAEKGDRPAVDRVLDVVAKLHARAAELEADTSTPIDELRVFDFEEDADDAAVRVLRAIGDDPLANGKFLLGLLRDPAACVREVDSGKEPSYGRFVDPHNGTCWRYWHAVQLSKALATCDASADAKRVTKGTGEKSAADKPPSELLEKGHGLPH